MATKYIHKQYGECEFVRVEGVNWIVRSCDTKQLYRVPPTRRIDFQPIQAAETEGSKTAVGNTQSTATDESKVRRGGLLSALRSSRTESKPATAKSQVSTDSDDLIQSTQNFVDAVSAADGECLRIDSKEQLKDKRRLRKVFESLRNGLSPIHTELRPYAVGIESIQQKANYLLNDVSHEGGRAVVLRGQYGQGKTFCLQLLRQMALEAGFVVASTEIDAHENQLDRPSSVYRSLMQSLKFPEQDVGGVTELVVRTHREITGRMESGLPDYIFAAAARRILLSELECEPLAWLLSDPDLLDKPELLEMLSCEPGVRAMSARKSHVIRGTADTWPRFNQGTQGDFASHLLSGIGRLTRFIGFKGFIVILDEIEKWQDLNWRAQTRAGNLLGGLIWGSSAEEGKRWCRTDRLDQRWLCDCDHSSSLKHSLRCGGFPFTTASRCSLGIAIAMTPRGEEGPESTWSEYGLLEVADLPPFSVEHLKSYMQKIFPDYKAAYELNGDLTKEMRAQAVTTWQKCSDSSARTAVQSVLTVLDRWRDSLAAS